MVSIPMTVLGGLQWDRNVLPRRKEESFNTDDGIRRAAIRDVWSHVNKMGQVSIPMTVLGGLQCAAFSA